MIRLIYKTILISIISSMLMIGDMVAFADSQTQASRNADGTYSKTKSYDMNDSKDQDAMNIITMLAIGGLAVQMLQYKKWSYDMMAAAAGGAAYMVGEVLNIMNVKNELEKLSVKIELKSDGKIDSKQVEYIKTLRESYVKVKAALERKSMLLKVALAGFGIAAGIAAYQKMMQAQNYAACSEAIKVATPLLEKCIEAGTATSVTVVAANEARACTQCLAQASSLTIATGALELNSNVIGPSIPKEAANLPIEAAAKTAEYTVTAGGTAETQRLAIATKCEPYLAHHQITKAIGFFAPAAAYQSFPSFLNTIDQRIAFIFMPNNYAPIKESYVSDNSRIKKNLKNVLEKFIPSASAGYGALLGLGTGALVTYVLIQKGMASYIDTMLASPGLRIAVWGVLAGLTMLGISSTEKKIKDVDDNIAKIDKILAETSALIHGVKTSAAKAQQVQIVNEGLFTQDVLLSNKEKTSCVAGTSASGTNACNSLTTLGTTLPGIQDMPNGLNSITTQLTGVVDGMSGRGTISGTTMSQANALAGKTAAILKYAKQQKTALNDLLKKQGKGIIDFDADQAKVKKGLFGAAAAALQSKGQTPSGFLASLGMQGTPGGAGSESAGLASVMKADGKGKLATPAVGSVGEMPKGNGLDFKMTDEAAAPAEVLSNGMAAGTANDKYDIKDNDINNNSKISIFEVISDRYLKSGYPKLLEEEKVIETK